MRIHRKSLAALLCAVLIAVSLYTPVHAAANIGNKRITSAGAVVIDFETGVELYGHEADKLRVPASMTKILTVYLVYEAIAEGIITMDTIVPVSDKVYALTRNYEFVNVALSKTGDYKVSELLDIVIVHSACGAAAALAELISGSEEAFTVKMNELTASLGVEAVFYDSYGGSDFNLISPRGMAVIARSLLMNYPEVLEKTSQKSVMFRGKSYSSTNSLLHAGKGVDGLKTGTTTIAGNCFTCTAQRDGRRLITVTMGSSAGGMRFVDTEIMLEYGFKVAEEMLLEYKEQLAEQEHTATENTAQTALVLDMDGEKFQLNSFTVEENAYFQIRDVAYMLSGTDKRFNVIHSEAHGALFINKGSDYILTGGEWAPTVTDGQEPMPENIIIFLNYEKTDLSAFNIGGRFYFNIYEIGEALELDISFDGDSGTIFINTNSAVIDELNPETVEHSEDNENADLSDGEETDETEITEVNVTEDETQENDEMTTETDKEIAA